MGFQIFYIEIPKGEKTEIPCRGGGIGQALA